jgi:hypothetical protein
MRRIEMPASQRPFREYSQVAIFPRNLITESPPMIGSSSEFQI